MQAQPLWEGETQGVILTRCRGADSRQGGMWRGEGSQTQWISDQPG